MFLVEHKCCLRGDFRPDTSSLLFGFTSTLFLGEQHCLGMALTKEGTALSRAKQIVPNQKLQYRSLFILVFHF